MMNKQFQLSRPTSSSSSMLRAATLTVTALVLTGCAITQHASPVTRLETREICVIENPAVRMDVFPSYKRALSDKGFSVTSLPADAPLDRCPLTSTYTANWAWDLAVYLVYANFKVYNKGELSGEATYNAKKGGLNLGKFIKGDEKIAELVDQLFPKGPMGAARSDGQMNQAVKEAESRPAVAAVVAPTSIAPLNVSDPPSPAVRATTQPVKSSTALPAEVPAAVLAKSPTGAPGKAAVGNDSWTVERLPEIKACSVTPRAVLSAKGPGFETYNVACGSGDVLAVRCEFGNCRVLR